MSPSPEEATGRHSLTVITSDVQSEILVLDARGRLVVRGLGPERSFELEPGIYRVKVLTGAESQEKVIVVSEARPEPVRFEPLAFASPVPLDGTSTSHEYHMDAANQESRVTHVADGTGSSLFFFVRDWTLDAEAPARPRVKSNPAEGLSLYADSAAGERKICDLTVGKSGTWGDPWAACTIDVAPGVYELRLELPRGETLRQSFVASADWQTQSFFFMRTYASDAGPQWRADLSRTSVLLSRTRGFSPHAPLLRTAELAKVTLAMKGSGDEGRTSRQLMPDQVRMLLRDKFEDPMLGIYGAHLLLLEAPVDVELFRNVVRNLRMVLGTGHPDVEALALRADAEPPPLPFDHPPMLCRSWLLIVDASVARPELVTESLFQRNPGEGLPEGPWHIRRSPAADATESEPDALELSDIENALAEDLGVMKQIRRRRRSSTARLALALAVPATPKAPQEASAGGGSEATSDARWLEVDQQLDRLDEPQEVQVELDPAHLRSMVRRFGIPSTQLKQILTNLEGKFTRSPGAPNLKVRWM